MEFNNYEYSVEQKCEGNWLFAKIAMIFFYVVYVGIYFALLVWTRWVPLGALIPVTLWILVFFTWRFVKPEYKYSVETDILTFSIIWGGRTKRERVKFRVSEADIIAPLANVHSDLSGIRIDKVYNALPSKLEPDAYAILFSIDGKISLFTFRATHDALRILSFYNRKTVIKETQL